MPYFFYQGKRCFYTCSGVGPPLLFLHGNTASSQMFQFLLPFYPPCFHCILLDFLGSGRSQRMPELPPQLWIDQGRQAAALIRHLGLGPVFLVGTSGGAWAALNAGLEHPDLVRGIVADSFDGRTLHRGFDRELLEERAAAKASHQARQFYQWCQGADWEEVVDRDTRSLVRCAREGLPLFSRPLEELQAPLLLMGSREDVMCRKDLEAEYQHILEILPQARMCLFDHGAHPALASNGLAAADAVRDFFS